MPSRTKMYEDDPKFLWKPILRTLAILLALVGIGTIAWAINDNPQYQNTSSTGSVYDSYAYNNYDEAFFLLPWEFISLGLSVCWNIANIAVLLARNRAMTPGANVACDLIIWLACLVTGMFAVIGVVQYIVFDPSSYPQSYSYGSGTFANGTAYQTLSNGTRTTDIPLCPGFDSCDAQQAFADGMHHKGVVVAVGCAMTFVVLLLHFALFISACRYTHARRHTVYGKQAKAITAEATEIARKMIADLGYAPPNQQHGQHPPVRQQQAEYQSVPQHDYYAPEQRPSMSEQAMQQRYEQQLGAGTATGSNGKQPMRDPVVEQGESSTAGPGERHPALRGGGGDRISYA